VSRHPCSWRQLEDASPSVDGAGKRGLWLLLGATGGAHVPTHRQRGIPDRRRRCRQLSSQWQCQHGGRDASWTAAGLLTCSSKPSWLCDALHAARSAQQVVGCASPLYTPDCKAVL
jgi:hypothetical protein